MAVFSSVIGYMLQQIAIKKIGASKSSIFVNLVPVFSIILSVIILGEELIPVKIFTSHYCRSMHMPDVRKEKTSDRSSQE